MKKNHAILNQQSDHNNTNRKVCYSSNRVNETERKRKKNLVWCRRQKFKAMSTNRSLCAVVRKKVSNEILPFFTPNSSYFTKIFMFVKADVLY